MSHLSFAGIYFACFVGWIALATVGRRLPGRVRAVCYLGMGVATLGVIGLEFLS